MNVYSKVPKNAVKRSLLSARKLHLHFDEYFASIRSRSANPVLFNLDLHISVMRDLQQELETRSMKTLRWSISGSNRFSRPIYKIADPVDVVNSKTWSALDDVMISQFENRYRKFLSKFDGFIVTHTPAFAQLYRNFNKPILVLNSTRYEAPYTNHESRWRNLDNYLSDAVAKKTLLLASNNLGDADYLKYRTGIDSQVVPSFCDYTKIIWKPGGTRKVVVSRSPEVEEFVEILTCGEWQGIRKVMGESYNWRQYLDVKEILYIPYNISTMSLFEFATAGIPVVVPSKDFLKQLSLNYSGILSELSYFQVGGFSVDRLTKDDPNNYLSEEFQDWWLNRADFYNEELMPNIRVINDFSELNASRLLGESYLHSIEWRNSVVQEARKKLISSFAEML
jgi:hypothetical protein